MTEYKHLTVTKEEHVALVTMCSTPVNTLTDGFMDELEHVFLALKEDAEIWAVVLCSSLKCFVSGADIKNLAICDRYGNITLAERMQRVFLAVEDFPHPVIGAVGGIAFGGGLELALCCDLRVFDDTTRVALPEAGLGIIPGAGGTQRLTKLVGPGAAKRILYTGETIRASDAYRLGLCEYTAEGNGCREKALEVAKTICEKAPKAVSLDKACVAYAQEHTLADGLDFERMHGSDLFATEDQKEGANAFLEKRPAEFHNK